MVRSLAMGSVSQQLLHADRQVAHPPAGRVIDGISNRGRHRYGGQLAEALGAERAYFLVELTDEQNVELRDVGIRRYEVAGIVAVEEAANQRVGLRLLEEGLPHAPD
jgi:hypothetical protein